MTKKAEFLEALSKHLEYGAAARALGVNPRTVFDWRQADPEFAEACELARSHAVDVLVGSVYERALNAPDPETKRRKYAEHPSILAAMFLIKGQRPEYKDAYRPEVSVREVRFTFEVPKPEGLKLPEHVIEGEVLSAD